MSIVDGSVVLVTGANGGIGGAYVAQALQRGARKVYATARTPRTWNDDRIVPLALDITNPESVASAARAAGDVTILVNNAGVSPHGSDMVAETDEQLHEIFETNFFGQLRMIRAFADILATSPGRAGIVDMHSALSWHAGAGSYSATKAAFWSATNSVRLSLSPRGIQVVGVHVGWVDTQMAAGVAGPKATPSEVASAAYSALDNGVNEVLVDDSSKLAKAGLAGPLERMYPQLGSRDS
ncbi:MULTISPECIES: SDR family oxidoreductase [unclassified Gordonia (in: high G+C Gram-positive bacteria)]